MQTSNAKYIVKYASEIIFGNQKFDDNRRVFVHIPKTAGTSFVHLIYDNFGQKAVYPNYLQRYNGYPANTDLKANAAKLLKNKSWLMGHFPIGFGKALWPEAKVYCFFREPKKRILSNILHFKQRHKDYQAKSLPTIYKEIGHVLSMQQAKLMGYAPKRDNRKQVEHIIRNLHYIGITEEYGQSLLWLEQEEQWDITVKKTNTSRYDHGDINELQLLIDQSEPLDQFVYAIAKDEFQKRTQHLSGNKS